MEQYEIIQEQHNKLMSNIAELEQYIQSEGTEWGEMVAALCQLAGYSDYISDELNSLLIKEIESALQFAKENTVWVEKEETTTRTIRYLSWDD
jgi:hypothetical protein